MTHAVYDATVASISDLKKNPMGTVAAGEGFAVVSSVATRRPSIACRRRPARRCRSGWKTWNSMLSWTPARASRSTKSRSMRSELSFLDAALKEWRSLDAMTQAPANA